MAHQEMPGSFFIPTRVSKTNGKDMFDCFIDIYAVAELADWLYYETHNSV